MFNTYQKFWNLLSSRSSQLAATNPLGSSTCQSARLFFFLVSDNSVGDFGNGCCDDSLSSGFSLGNFISTAEKIRLPDDCTIGYIIEALLEVTLTHTHLFHSHLENLQKLPSDTVLEQVSVSTTGTV